jgi:hypothetical protein
MFGRSITNLFTETGGSTLDELYRGQTTKLLRWHCCGRGGEIPHLQWAGLVSHMQKRLTQHLITPFSISAEQAVHLSFPPR